MSVRAPDGARERLSARVARLRHPESYPQATRGVEAIETHLSWVFLTERHAYKLKKPVRTPWLDYTTVDGRKRACEVELALNRRLAPDVYLAVVPYVHAKTPCLEQPGTPDDWLVKMRRLPSARMLDEKIARADVAPSEVDALARVLTAFYRSTRRAPLAGPAYRAKVAGDLAHKRASVSAARYGLNAAQVTRVCAHQDQWLAQHGALLEARAGSLVDAHGDLRPEHVCLEPSGPAIIDCLEFDRTLRELDPVSELSFLALECRRLGAPWIGERLLAVYREQARDAFAPELVCFYQSYHALVRAAIAVWHLDDDAIDGRERWRARGHAYLELAQA